MTRLYKLDATLTLAVEANSRAEAKRLILDLAREVKRGLPDGASTLKALEDYEEEATLRGVYQA